MRSAEGRLLVGQVEEEVTIWETCGIFCSEMFGGGRGKNEGGGGGKEGGMNGAT